jgi:5-methylcytosine-specific restriction protein A
VTVPYSVPTYNPHRKQGESRHTQYDRTRRNRQSKAFYNSTPWLKLRMSKLRQDPMCQRCRAMGTIVQATHVHHVRPITEDYDGRLDMDNLESLCPSCHGREHAPH